ncbi:MAG TPA: hypothetical protein VHE30_00710 [Polyangiaceae bacterium]|nr:hypothetical protein [Polyangiaceae bacterium]
MELEQGGRVTLRLARVTDAAAEYGAELVTKDRRFEALARVSLPGGAVDFAHDGDAAPSWLVEVARTTLRAAHRTVTAGGSWPRRLSRWRGGPEGED